MSDLWKEKGSFLFGTTDMYERFGIKLAEMSIPHDVLIPGLRARKQTIPQQHGAYDFGAQYYDERTIEIDCVTKRVITRDDTREIAYILSKKSQIRFWTEPDKYYIGRVYQAPTLEQLRNVGNQFSLTFVCEPFAYGLTKTVQFENQMFIPEYPGTAGTPTYIVITNTGTGTAKNIQIKKIDKKEAY